MIINEAIKISSEQDCKDAYRKHGCVIAMIYGTYYKYTPHEGTGVIFVTEDEEYKARFNDDRQDCDYSFHFSDHIFYI